MHHRYKKVLKCVVQCNKTVVECKLYIYIYIYTLYIYILCRLYHLHPSSVDRVFWVITSFVIRLFGKRAPSVFRVTRI